MQPRKHVEHEGRRRKARGQKHSSEHPEQETAPAREGAGEAAAQHQPIDLDSMCASVQRPPADS